MRSIWDLQITISRRLLCWSGLSMLAGSGLVLSGNAFWGGFGIQAIIWGIIDAAIALLGRRRARRRSLASYSPDQLLQENRRLRRILWVNTFLDVVYVTGGIVLASLHKSIFWQGNGWGIALQGGFLFFFDLIHAQIVPPGDTPELAQAFLDSEHLPFLWEGGRPAALLVHGFPGTPAEMRPLGECLHREGWTVQGILLPGFGPQIDTLVDRRYEEWVEAIDRALVGLGHQHSPVLLVGYSMGGALSIIAASKRSPDGLILMAPFWWSISPLKSFLVSLLRPFLPRYVKPFKEADFSDPQVQVAVSNFIPHADLDDQVVQDEIRQVAVPVSIFNQLAKLSKRAYREAASVRSPLLVLQGKQDELASPDLTRRLLARFPDQDAQEKPRYLELDAGHDLMNTEDQAWPVLEKAVLSFAESLSSG